MDVFIWGVNGKMGRALTEAAAAAGVNVAGGFDLTPCAATPTFDKIDAVNVKCDAVIDFSRPDALTRIIPFVKANKLPAVICTTGHNGKEIDEIKRLSKSLPVFYSGNMSVGVSLLSELVYKAAKVLGERFDIEIIEKHHNQKTDAPSGTAKMLAGAANKASGDALTFKHGRVGLNARRAPNEIGLHSVRGGTVVGEHEVIFAGNDEIITLSHTALSKRIFAEGALRAARFIMGKPAGLYDMNDLVKE